MSTEDCIRSARRLAALGAAALVMGLAGPSPAGACEGEYVVRSGDTLSRIARTCGASIESLLRANPQVTSPSRLSVGWTLAVPEAGEVAGEPGHEASDAAAVPPQVVEPLVLQGRIVNGRRCAMIQTDEGEAYGVVSPELSFRSGSVVAVQGELIDDPSCTGSRTLLVTNLSSV